MVEMGAQHEFPGIGIVAADMRNNDVHEVGFDPFALHAAVQDDTLAFRQKGAEAFPWFLVRLKPNVTFFNSSGFGHIPVY